MEKKPYLYRAFDPDRKKAGAAKWGAWITDRWHTECVKTVNQ